MNSDIIEKSPLAMALFQHNRGLQANVSLQLLANSPLFAEITGISKQQLNHEAIQLLLTEFINQLNISIESKLPSTFFSPNTKKSYILTQWESNHNLHTIILTEENHNTSLQIPKDETDERIRTELTTRVQQKIINSIIEKDDISQIIQDIQTELSSIIDTKNFCVAFYNEKTDSFSAPYIQDKTDYLNTWPAKGSLTGKVIFNNKSILLTENNINEIIKNKTIPLIGAKATCWMGIPLRIEGKPIGAIVLQSYDGSVVYSKKDMQLMELIANHISIALKQKNNENQIKLLGKAVEQSPLSIVITNKHGEIEYVNPKFTEVTGYSYDEVIGENPRILKGEHNPTQIYRELWDTLTKGNEWFGELENKKKNGEYYWENISISPITDNNGTTTHYIGIKEDITDKKIMLMELLEAKSRAEESDHLKSAFLANMSHEIKTPLNGIIGFALMLSNKNLDQDKVKEYAQTITLSSNRLLDLMNNIIDISKIESNNMKVNYTLFSANKLVSDIAFSFSIIAQKKSLHIFTQFPDTINDTLIYSDESKVTQVISNLIDNAIKFTSSGHIEIGFNTTANEIEFHIKDTGIGIKKAEMSHVFDRFYQSDNSYTRDHDGAGLGLSICKGITDLLYGSIRLKSIAGKGTTFYVSLPLNTNQEPNISNNK